jgi:hypothetical protein
MSYSTEQATLLALQLERLATGGAHQIAGQFANLGFWVDEAVHAIAVIDVYPRRFRDLRAAQMAWVSAHGTMTLGPCTVCGGRCELGPRPPEAPTRTSSGELDEARRAVRQGCYRFLLRCHRLGLLDESALRAACERIAVSVEREDLP